MAEKSKVHVRTGDYVEVIAGKDRGKRGKILEVVPKTSRVVVEGVNVVKRHTRPSQNNPQGGIIEHAAAVHSSNVMIYCRKCNSRTRIGKKILAGGEKVRYCKNCGEVLDS